MWATLHLRLWGTTTSKNNMQTKKMQTLDCSCHIQLAYALLKLMQFKAKVRWMSWCSALQLNRNELTLTFLLFFRAFILKGGAQLRRDDVPGTKQTPDSCKNERELLMLKVSWRGHSLSVGMSTDGPWVGRTDAVSFSLTSVVSLLWK